MKNISHITRLVFSLIFPILAESQENSQSRPVTHLVQGPCGNGAHYQLQQFSVEIDDQKVLTYYYEGPLEQGNIASAVSIDRAKKICVQRRGHTLVAR